MALIAASAITACGGDDGDNSDAQSGDETATEADTPDAPDEGGGDTGGEVPDPCTLLSPDELAALLGTAPGEGDLSSSDPTARQICAFNTGLVLSVEIAENYEQSIDVIESSGFGPVAEVPGVGEAAVWQDVGGGVGQFIALGSDYFVGVSVFEGGQAPAQAVAEAMLAAL